MLDVRIFITSVRMKLTMNIQEIFTQFQTPKKLQEHIVRVISLAEIIIKICKEISCFPETVKLVNNLE